jgi:hypothetical protein
VRLLFVRENELNEAQAKENEKRAKAKPPAKPKKRIV